MSQKNSKNLVFKFVSKEIQNGFPKFITLPYGIECWHNFLPFIPKVFCESESEVNRCHFLPCDLAVKSGTEVACGCLA